MNISGQFKRMLIEKYIGADYFRVCSATKKVLLKDAYDTHTRELHKKTWQKWELLQYTNAERIHGRKGIYSNPNPINTYRCVTCNEYFRMKKIFCDHIRKCYKIRLY